MFAVVVKLGDIIGAIVVALVFLVLGVGYVIDRRKQRRRDEAEKLGAGGRGVKR